MTTVFVSGCYDILHGGHVQFLQHAKALGDQLVVCLPTDRVIRREKSRSPCLPLEHKRIIFESLSFVDRVVVGDDVDEPGINFETEFLRIRPDILAVTDDDRYESVKRQLCNQIGARYVRVSRSKDWPNFATRDLLRRMRAPRNAPARVDFAGGWLDVPRFARKDAFVVNCTITPFMTTESYAYQPGGGVGGSASHALLEGKDPLSFELARGVGWQDPAVIQETGLCVWRSGPHPVLRFKANPNNMLGGRMALLWTGKTHDTAGLVERPRDYGLICSAGRAAADAVAMNSLPDLCNAVELSYRAQLDEGMEPLPSHGEQAKKYCGAGWGGYAVYMFESHKDREHFVDGAPARMAIEPYMRSAT